MGEISGRALSTGSGAPPVLASAVFDWLARAQEEPRQAHREWAERGTALLPLGRRFNTVSLCARIVHAALGTGDLDTVNAALAGLLCGPVIHNRPQHLYYPLVEISSAARWNYPDDAPMLSTGNFLSVPASDLTGPYGLYWAVRPRLVGDLCPVPSVAALIHIARGAFPGRAR